MSNVGPRIPANMKIAGRVTGTGQFKRDASDDAFEEYCRDADNKQESNRPIKMSAQSSADRFYHSTSTTPIYHSPADFPTLQLLSANSSEANSSRSINQQEGPPNHKSFNSLHPLSLVNKPVKKNITELSNELQSGSISSVQKRNEAFALALGLKESSQDNNRLRSNTYSSPLYPGWLLSWGVQNKAALVKTESKIEKLLVDRNSSAQLPPMAKPVREGVHLLAKYYFLTCQEFDHDPKRYISLVKTVESCRPSVLLSDAMKKEWASVSKFRENLSPVNVGSPSVFASPVGDVNKGPVFVHTITGKVSSVLESIFKLQFSTADESEIVAITKAMSPISTEMFNASTVCIASFLSFCHQDIIN